MRVKIVLIGFLTMFLAGCSIHTPKLFTFDEYNFVLNNQINNILSIYSDIFFGTGDIDQKLKLNIDGKNPDSDFNLNIDLSLTIDSFTHNYSSQINYNTNILQKSDFQKVTSSGKLYYSNIDYTPFFYLDQFNIDMGTGNIESKLIETISSSITNKRILIDIQNQENIIQKRVDINNILLDIQKINNCKALYPIKKTIYNTNYVYKIGLDSNKLQKCLNDRGIVYSGIVFESFLGGKSSKKANLEIKKFQLSEYDNRIKGVINYNQIYLEVLDNKNNLLNKITIQKTKDKTKMKIENGLFSLNIDLKEKQESMFFEGKIIIQQNNNIKKLLFDLEGNLTKQTNPNLIKQQPSNYIIMSQLLGDRFSLQNILGTVK